MGHPRKANANGELNLYLLSRTGLVKFEETAQVLVAARDTTEARQTIARTGGHDPHYIADTGRWREPRYATITRIGQASAAWDRAEIVLKVEVAG